MTCVHPMLEFKPKSEQSLQDAVYIHIAHRTNATAVIGKVDSAETLYYNYSKSTDSKSQVSECQKKKR